MRRTACWLTIMGLSVQPAWGQNLPQGSSLRPASPPAANTAPLSAPAGVPAQQPAPQRYLRAANDDTSTELKKYYNELFQRTVSDTQQDAREAINPSLKLTPQGVPAAPPAATQDLIHAEYQRDARQVQEPIVPVVGERFGGLPHPGANPVAPLPRPAAAPQNPPAQVDPAFGAQSRFGASLSDPISLSPAARPAPAQLKPESNPFAPSHPAPQVSVAPVQAPAEDFAFGPTAAPRPVAPATFEAVSAPQVSLLWGKDSEINIGQESRCFLLVKNNGQTPARDFEVRAQFPDHVRITATAPQTVGAGPALAWQLTELRPGEERRFEVTFVPAQRGEVTAHADVRFSLGAPASFAVAEPLLAVEVSGPQQVMVGEAASQTVTVSNPGTGIATQVQIEALIPEGLEHARGKRLVMDVGSLNPGESRNVRLALTGIAGGKQRIEVNATADSGLSRATAAEINVVAPSLAATVQGPALRYLGRQGTYVVSVGNDGQAASDNIQLRYKVPAEFEFVSADLGVQYDANTRLLTWFVGRLEQQQTAELKVTLVARQLGDSVHAIRASSEHGALSESELATRVEGTSSLSIQVTDQEDPVEVGSQAVYEVRVRNEGSAAAKSVGIACELAPGTKLVGVEGPVEYRVEKNLVVFRPLAELPAGQSVTCKVKISAAQPGSLRFRAQLSSESISEPLLAEELTKFYGE